MGHEYILKGRIEVSNDRNKKSITINNLYVLGPMIRVKLCKCSEELDMWLKAAESTNQVREMSLDLPWMPRAERENITICCTFSGVKAPTLEVAERGVALVEVVVAWKPCIGFQQD